MDVRIDQRWSTALEVLVQGQFLMETGWSLVLSLVHTKMWTLVAWQVRKCSFFSTILYRDHIESYLSELTYSELVQGQLEKMAFPLVDGPPIAIKRCQRTKIRIVIKRSRSSLKTMAHMCTISGSAVSNNFPQQNSCPLLFVLLQVVLKIRAMPYFHGGNCTSIQRNLNTLPQKCDVKGVFGCIFTT
jgi:hypothetical protein